MLEALQHNPQAKAARAARDVAQVGADREKPVARPTLEATASGTLQGPRVTFPGVDGPATVLPEGVGRVDVVIEQPLYRAGQRAAKQRYTAQSAIVEWDYRKALAEVALTARKAYFDVLRAASGLRTAQDGLEAAQRYRTLVQRQVAGGFAKPVDATTVEGQVAEAQSGVIQAEGGLALARQAFNRALGRLLMTPVELQPVEALPNVPDSPDAAIALALRNRPELAALEQSRTAARAGVALAKSQAQPGLNLRGQVTEQTPSAFVHEHYAAIGLELRWPILDAG
ncbi:MAG TPA: TolC family protein, partial [Chthonomonadaceae bacterium]|nr:TolC family protein [Chthonomonadaceae bacterium]